MCLSVPGKLVEINGKGPLDLKGKVDFGGVLKEVNLAYVPEAEVGQYVIVHVGFAISIVNEKEAKKTLEYLKEIKELGELDGEL